jgi:hypothetical protein
MDTPSGSIASIAALIFGSSMANPNTLQRTPFWMLNITPLENAGGSNRLVRPLNPEQAIASTSTPMQLNDSISPSRPIIEKSLLTSAMSKMLPCTVRDGGVNGPTERTRGTVVIRHLLS